MRRKYKLLVWAVILSPIFLYHKITHMNGDELAWVKCWDMGDTLFFESGSNGKDTVIFNSTKIYNSLCPINKNTNIELGSEYNATAFLNYELLHNGLAMVGRLWVEKKEQDQPIALHLRLCCRFALYLHPYLKKYFVEGIEYDDCVRIDGSNSDVGWPDHKKCINSFLWSK